MDNLLGVEDAQTLARVEERVSKTAALRIFRGELPLDGTPDSFANLASIHRCLFGDIYDFAGKKRTVNLAKGHFRFVPVLYLDGAIAAVEEMPQTNFDEILNKYVEMNIVHPFREGNGRSMRIWLDGMLRSELGRVVDWAHVDRADYLLAMERSPVRTTEIRALLAAALTSAVQDRDLFMRGLDASYAYEDYSAFRARDLIEWHIAASGSR